MDVGSADGCFQDSNQHIVIANLGNRNFFEPKSWFGSTFHDGFHHLLHGEESSWKSSKSQAPSPKVFASRHPEKLQASISKHQEPNAVWSLNIDLLWSLDFGAWSLRITRTIRHPLRPLSALALGSFPQDDATACR